MKKVFLFIFIIVSSLSTIACDICGYGVGNYYVGLLPQFSRSFIGVRYQFSKFHTSIKNSNTEYSNDLFETAEVWGGINLGKKWQLLGIIPFNIINQKNDDGTYETHGLGDVAVMANYKLFDHISSTKNKKLITQQFWLGGGIKLATGKFSADKYDPAFIALANTQAGSGSTDFILNATYNININKLGFSNSIRYKINTANKDAYFFGNKFTAGSIAYYQFTKNNSTITPNAGLLYEHTEANKLANKIVDETGGYLLSCSADVEINFGKTTVGVNIQLPLQQNFANAQTNNRLKGMLHVTFSF